VVRSEKQEFGPSKKYFVCLLLPIKQEVNQYKTKMPVFAKRIMQSLHSALPDPVSDD